MRLLALSLIAAPLHLFWLIFIVFVAATVTIHWVSLRDYILSTIVNDEFELITYSNHGVNFEAPITLIPLTWYFFRPGRICKLSEYFNSPLRLWLLFVFSSL